ncbi:MAG: hypothetical protein ACRDQF_12485, partial [Thermocrispum sp.]
VEASTRAGLQAVMTAGAGVLRSSDGLSAAARGLTGLAARVSEDPCTETWEVTNLLTVAAALAAAARGREETRGSHWREDFPAADPGWLGHLDTRMDDTGRLRVTFSPLDAKAKNEASP